MIRDTVSDTEKFFFDQHDFSDDAPDDELETAEPPPPMFTEEQLAEAKKFAYTEGQTRATKDEQDSREQHLATVMESISRDLSVLFQSEKAREDLYEREAVNLALAAISKLFPHIAKKHGFSELKDALSHVIQSQSGQKNIVVRVNPDLVDGVDKHFKKLQQSNPDMRYTVQGDVNLSGTACALSWDDGGALHDTSAMADSILEILKDGLAAEAPKRHDIKDKRDQADTPQDIELKEHTQPDANDTARAENAEENNTQGQDLKESPDE